MPAVRELNIQIGLRARANHPALLHLSDCLRVAINITLRLMSVRAKGLLSIATDELSRVKWVELLQLGWFLACSMRPRGWNIAQIRNALNNIKRQLNVRIIASGNHNHE